MSRITGMEVKKLLKQHGIDTKLITANNRGGSSLRVRIYSKAICREKVEKILAPLERIRRCEATGDILCGGNFFVFVDYHSSLID